MVEHPGEYPWSSFRCNASGEPGALVSAHALYRQLGEDPAARREAYRALFAQEFGQQMLEDIRAATNKAWVLGDDRFRERIQAQLRRRAAPKPMGGDRKSKEYRANRSTHRV